MFGVNSEKMVLGHVYRDEELLGRGLELNDNLQSLLAKHDAIASGLPLPAEVSESITEHDAITSSSPPPVDVSVSITSSRTPVVPQPAAISWYDDGEEDEDDDFAQLARRSHRPTFTYLSNQYPCG